MTGHAVHSSRIDQGVSAVMTGARLIVWLEDVMNRNRAEHDPDNPFEPPYTTLHCGVMEGGTAANIVASSAWFYTDIRAIPTEDPMEYVARYRAHVAEAVVPAMKAIAAEAGIDVELVSLVPGLKPEAGWIGRAPDATADGRQWQSCRVVRHRGRDCFSRPDGQPWSAGPAISRRLTSRTSILR